MTRRMKLSTATATALSAIAIAGCGSGYQAGWTDGKIAVNTAECVQNAVNNYGNSGPVAQAYCHCAVTGIAKSFSYAQVKYEVSQGLLVNDARISSIRKGCGGS